MSNNKRLSFTPLPKYSPCVLIGHWFEDALKYERKPLVHHSTYSIDFRDPGTVHVDDKNVWDQRLAGRGFDPRIILCDGTKFLENYSTTYDLTYRHFKKGLRGPILKSRRTDWIEHFGNITNYGLKKVMERKWQCDKNTSLISEYEERFPPPKCNDYVKVRRAHPRQNFSSPCVLNQNVRY